MCNCRRDWLTPWLTHPPTHLLTHWQPAFSPSTYGLPTLYLAYISPSFSLCNYLLITRQYSSTLTFTSSLQMTFIHLTVHRRKSSSMFSQLLSGCWKRQGQFQVSLYGYVSYYLVLCFALSYSALLYSVCLLSTQLYSTLLNWLILLNISAFYAIILIHLFFTINLPSQLHSLLLSPFFLLPSLLLSYPPSLPPLLPQSLTRSLTRSLPFSLPFSLPLYFPLRQEWVLRCWPAVPSACWHTHTL